MKRKKLIIGAGIAVLVIIALVNLYNKESAKMEKMKEKYPAPATSTDKELKPATEPAKKPDKKPEKLYNQTEVEDNVIKYLSTEFENGNQTYRQNTYITLDTDNNTITFTDKNSFDFTYNTSSELTDLFIGESRVGYKIMIKDHEVLKSVSLFLIGGLPENSILQEFHDGTMLEYFGISQIN